MTPSGDNRTPELTAETGTRCKRLGNDELTALTPCVPRRNTAHETDGGFYAGPGLDSGAEMKWEVGQTFHENVVPAERGDSNVPASANPEAAARASLIDCGSTSPRLPRPGDITPSLRADAR